MCANAVGDPKAKVQVKTRDDAGQLSAKLVIPLAGYSGEPVTVRLDDLDSQPIAERRLGALAPKGAAGRQWRFKTKASGLQQVVLKESAGTPGTFQVKVKAKRWFTAAAANQDAPSTTLTLTLGGQCFSHAATKKSD